LQQVQASKATSFSERYGRCQQTWTWTTRGGRAAAAAAAAAATAAATATAGGFTAADWDKQGLQDMQQQQQQQVSVQETHIPAGCSRCTINKPSCSTNLHVLDNNAPTVRNNAS
jgi:hypothetical protein